MRSPTASLNRRRRGSALTLGIVAATVVSSLVAAMAWTASAQTASTNQLSKMDQAFFAAESGAQRVAWYCKNYSMASITSPVTGTVNGCSYSTSFSNGSASAINVSSCGSLGTTSYAMTAAYTPPSPAVPAFVSGSNFDNKNIDIIGNAQVGGDYSNGGSGSLTGNLIYGGNANQASYVSGSLTKGSITPINFSTLDTTLRAGAVTKAANATFDFTALAGTNKVIYVNGECQNPVIIGAGTLYVNGNLLINNSDVTFGSPSAKVNLVVNGDINFSKAVVIYGSLYGKNNLNRAQLDVTGCLYVAGVANSNSGHCTWTFNSAPWFDPRSSGGSGSSTMLTSAFSGPSP